jgi:hypothetical protein
MAKEGKELQRDYRKRFGFPTYPWQPVVIVQWFDEQLVAGRLKPAETQVIAEHLLRLSELRRQTYGE